MHDDETVDIKEIKTALKKYQDANLYCLSERRDARREKIQLWRTQMKNLEDKPQYRKMYDRIGQDQMSLLQERDQARTMTELRNKKKYQSIRPTKGHSVEYNDIKKDKNGEKRHFTTLDVQVTPQSYAKKQMGKMIYSSAISHKSLTQQIVKGR